MWMVVSRTHRSVLTQPRSDFFFLTSTTAILSETHVGNFQEENLTKYMVGLRYQLFTIQFKLFFHIWYSKWTSDDMQMYRIES